MGGKTGAKIAESEAWVLIGAGRDGWEITARNPPGAKRNGSPPPGPMVQANDPHAGILRFLREEKRGRVYATLNPGKAADILTANYQEAVTLWERLEGKTAGRLEPPPLTGGVHSEEDYGACAVEAVTRLQGADWTDDPESVCRVLAECMRNLNDNLDGLVRDRMLGPLLRGAADDGGRNPEVEAARWARVREWNARSAAVRWLESVAMTDEAKQARRAADLIKKGDESGAAALLDEVHGRTDAAAHKAWADLTDAVWNGGAAGKAAPGRRRLIQIRSAAYGRYGAGLLAPDGFGRPEPGGTADELQGNKESSWSAALIAEECAQIYAATGDRPALVKRGIADRMRVMKIERGTGADDDVVELSVEAVLAGTVDKIGASGARLVRTMIKDRKERAAGTA